MHRHDRIQRSSFRVLLSTLIILPVLATGAVLHPAGAAAAGPTQVSPIGGATVSGTPTFTWERLPEPTQYYDVQVLDGVTVVASVNDTVNNQWVPTGVELPTGRPLTWQVRGLVGGVESDWSVATFTRDLVTAPVLVGPDNAKILSQPGDPLIYRWKPVPGAKSYTVEVGPDPDFVDPNLVTTYTTTTTMFAPNIIPGDGTYYWRVTGNLSSGVKSTRSEVRSYTINAVVRSGGDLDVPGAPEYPADGQTVTEVVLDWHPVDGASTYNLQIATDVNFNTIVQTVNNIKSTRYSPTTTLNNDQYWWRIAPVNADNYQTPWAKSPIWSFTRNWTDQAHLQYPANGAVVGDPFYFQWSPVPLASHYVLEMSTSSSFTPTSTSCTTVHTTYTPSRTAGDCWPGAAGTYYWRVKSYDDPLPVSSEVVIGEVHSFTYNPDLVTLLAPANGATVTVPTLSWQPYPNADSYKVTLTNTSNNATSSKTTVTTTLTWPSKLTNAATYKWQVQPVFDDGRIGAAVLLPGQPTFTAMDPDPGVATSPEPVSEGAPGVRPPLLTWTPVAGATSYTVQVRPVGTIGWYTLNQSYAYASGSDTDGNKLDPGTYEWQVVAHGGPSDGTLSSTSRTYTILPFGTVTGYRAAITGTAAGSVATSCTAQLPTGCQNLRQTPVLRWDPVDGAASYSVVISHDQNLTNPVKTVTVRGASIWMDTVTLPDGDAGTAYYWDVIPCGPAGNCAPQVPAQHQFNKIGLPVQLVSPVTGTAANDIRFTWVDYLSTLQASDGTGSSLATPATTEARQYRIQVSSTADFSNILDDRTVDQTTYTPYDRTYPEQPLYWRVRAMDGSNNPLPWSSTGTVTKSSPGPILSEGASGETFSGSISLGWQPLAYAKTYEVRIYPAGANPDTATALITQSGLKQNSFTPSAPLAPGSYIWRVRRADADARAGQWSTSGSAPGTGCPCGAFTSAGAAPTLLSPSGGAEVAPRTGLFTWEPALDAPVSSYRIELVRPGQSITVNTSATAYAPTTVLSDGSWTWRVTALDTKDSALGVSAWRAFVVNGTLKPTTSVTIAGNNTVGSLLTINPFDWNQPGTATTYQWYQGGTAIAGATGATYTVAATDAGKTLKVRVTGIKAGYTTGSADSNAISVGATTTPGGTGGGGTTTPATVSSQTTATLARRKIRKRRHGLVDVSVTCSRPTSGVLQAYDGSRLLTSVTFTAASGGRITIRLPRLKVGRHPIWVKYLGASRINGSSSPRVTLRVVR